jgi:membrane protease YdiL (CAAX protease family)
MSSDVETFPSEVVVWRKRSLLKYFFFVFALTIPFWLLGALTGIQLLPGLPVAALATFCPAIAAAILVYQESKENKTAGVIALLTRTFDVRVRAKIWYAPTLLLMPAVMTLSYVVLRLMGVPVPALEITVVSVLALFVIFFLSALGEELGWSGYATDPMQLRWGALVASLVLGMVWAIYHWVGLAQANRSVEWIAWWSLGTVAARIIIVWLYNNTGRSVFIASLFHTTINVTWQVFPIRGSFYDPRVTAIIMAGVAVIAVAAWGPRTLARYRYA